MLPGAEWRRRFSAWSEMVVSQALDTAISDHLVA
jgi:hypothetical protein